MNELNRYWQYFNGRIQPGQVTIRTLKNKESQKIIDQTEEYLKTHLITHVANGATGLNPMKGDTSTSRLAAHRPKGS